jgi:DNA-binding transcriptional regulator YhcF (GntR family)
MDEEQEPGRIKPGLDQLLALFLSLFRKKRNLPWIRVRPLPCSYFVRGRCHNTSMRLWFAPSSEVPIYQQLATQVELAILAGDLKPGDRLPSTRELARRFALHPNTILAGYRKLERDGWTECRHGSGVYVRSISAPGTPLEILDQHIAGFFRAVRELNLPAWEVHARVAQWLGAPPPDHLLLIEPDAQMQQILLTEIRRAISFPVRAVTPAECPHREVLTGAIPLCRPSQAAAVRALLPPGIELTTLQIRSATAWLNPWLPAPQGHLIAVVSHWPEFLTTARTMLIAAGLPTDALLFRDARKPRWRSGLDQATAILCDAYTASLPTLPPRPHVILFPLLADAAIADLARHATPALQI